MAHGASIPRDPIRVPSSGDMIAELTAGPLRQVVTLCVPMKPNRAPLPQAINKGSRSPTANTVAPRDPPAHSLPPLRRGVPPQICHQAVQALVAENCHWAGLPLARSSSAIRPLGGSKGAAHADEWHHLKLGRGW